MDSVLKYSSTGLQWCQITWHTENMSVSPLTYCPPTVLPALSWYISCIVTRRQNIRGAGIPVPNPVLSPAWKCPWETAVPDEIGTGLDWWQGSLVFQDLEGCWLLPKHWSHGWENGPLWLSPGKHLWTQKIPQTWIMRQLRWVKRWGTHALFNTLTSCVLPSFYLFSGTA